jgi:4-hydroxy-tetrahydrodipicolinate reductase
MKIALIGYGKMGKEIESIALSRGHEIVYKINRANAHLLDTGNFKTVDVAIEFSTPDTVVSHIEKCLQASVPVVVGTTGWYQHFDAVKQQCTEKNGGLFYATNFSVGVNLFFKINTALAMLMNRYSDYEVSMEEIHHVHKLDKPSGTAITLANQIIAEIDRKHQWSITDKSADTLFIHDVREGEVPGTHIIKYHSAIDDIEIMHKAHNRKGFAMGAVLAAEFLAGKKGIYNMSDII